jgi:glutamate-1-semialdehyde aminotransferase
MHDATFSDNMRVNMWEFVNSGTENALYVIRINGHITVL